MKRRVSRLGEVEQTRAGAVKLDWEEINRAVGELLTKFYTCGPDGHMLEPATNTVGTEISVFDPQLKDLRPVKVVVAPDNHPQGVLVSGYNEAFLSKKTGRRRDIVTLTPAKRLCTTRSHWANAMRPVLAHELTHSTDPGVGKRKKSYDVDAVRSGKQTMCQYYNDPGEVKAHINEVRAELRSRSAQLMIKRMKENGTLRTPADALPLSSRWKKIDSCYSGKNRRRFYKMAALEV